MVMADIGGDVAEKRQRRQDAGADVRVLAHAEHLGIAEPSGLADDAGRHADLADVVEDRR